MRFVVQPTGRGGWFGIWDTELGHWVDHRRWLQPAVAQSEADRMNEEL